MTITEKLVAYYMTLPKSIQKELLQRLFHDMHQYIKIGTNKNFVVVDSFGRQTSSENLKIKIKEVMSERAQFYLQEARLESNLLELSLFSDNFFPTSLFTFINPQFFYQYVAEAPNLILFPKPNNVEKMLQFVFNKEHSSFVSMFRYILINNKALISGGFILNAESVLSQDIKEDEAKQKDMDIYVNLKNICSLFIQLKELGWTRVITSDSHMTPIYDQSFIRKNHILYRIRMTEELQWGVDLTKPPIDIMIIPDEFTLESVVTNFDLTFCQVWYDGYKSYSNHWRDIALQRGSLQPEYHESYINGNLFLRQRIKKYRERGYTILCPEIRPEVQVALDRYNADLEVYRRLLTEYNRIYDTGINADINVAEQNIKRHTRLHTLVSKRILDSFNRKTTDDSLEEEWVVSKLYEKIVFEKGEDCHIMYLLYPMYPLTYRRFIELLPKLYPFQWEDEERTIENVFELLNNIEYQGKYLTFMINGRRIMTELFLGRRKKSKRNQNKKQKKSSKQSSKRSSKQRGSKTR